MSEFSNLEDLALSLGYQIVNMGGVLRLVCLLNGFSTPFSNEKALAGTLKYMAKQVTMKPGPQKEPIPGTVGVLVLRGSTYEERFQALSACFPDMYPVKE